MSDEWSEARPTEITKHPRRDVEVGNTFSPTSAPPAMSADGFATLRDAGVLLQRAAEVATRGTIPDLAPGHYQLSCEVRVTPEGETWVEGWALTAHGLTISDGHGSAPR